MFENPRRSRQARNFTTNVPKILALKSSSEQIFFRKLPLGAPVKRFIEALVSYASVATQLYIMIFNFVGLSLLFLLSGTRIKWTEPKENTLETQTSLPLDEFCEFFLVFTAYYLLMIYLFFNIEFILQYYFPLDHYILMGFLNIVYGTFVPAFVTGPANIFTSNWNKVRNEGSLRESSLEAEGVHVRRDFERVEYLLSLHI